MGRVRPKYPAYVAPVFPPIENPKSLGQALPLPVNMHPVFLTKTAKRDASAIVPDPTTIVRLTHGPLDEVSIGATIETQSVDIFVDLEAGMGGCFQGVALYRAMYQAHS